jgi:hypothetical protein
MRVVRVESLAVVQSMTTLLEVDLDTEQELAVELLAGLLRAAVALEQARLEMDLDHQTLGILSPLPTLELQHRLLEYCRAYLSL